MPDNIITMATYIFHNIAGYQAKELCTCVLL